MIVSVPLRTGSGLNAREHWRVKARRVKAEREAVAWVLETANAWEVPPLPVLVTLTRVGPSNGLDDDNLAGSLKAVRDEVAKWLCVDDRKRDVVRYAYAQQRGKEWGVTVLFESMQEALA